MWRCSCAIPRKSLNNRFENQVLNSFPPQIFLTKTEKTGGLCKDVVRAKMALVDLAGSEVNYRIRPIIRIRSIITLRPSMG
jgi:hypothetical protein